MAAVEKSGGKFLVTPDKQKGQISLVRVRNVVCVRFYIEDSVGGRPTDPFSMEKSSNWCRS